MCASGGTANGHTVLEWWHSSALHISSRTCLLGTFFTLFTVHRLLTYVICVHRHRRARRLWRGVAWRNCCGCSMAACSLPDAHDAVPRPREQRIVGQHQHHVHAAFATIQNSLAFATPPHSSNLNCKPPHGTTHYAKTHCSTAHTHAYTRTQTHTYSQTMSSTQQNTPNNNKAQLRTLSPPQLTSTPSVVS